VSSLRSSALGAHYMGRYEAAASASYGALAHWYLGKIAKAK
jgi:hypothetical protein